MLTDIQVPTEKNFRTHEALSGVYGVKAAGLAFLPPDWRLDFAALSIAVSIAYMYLHILECLEPSTAEVPLVAAADQWAKAANSRFWNELGIGRRVLSIAQKAAKLSDISGWNSVCEALMIAGVTVDADFLRRVHG